MSTTPSSGRIVLLLRVLVLPALIVGAIVAAWKLGYFDLDHRQELLQRVERWRNVPGAELVFIAAFSLAVVLCLPITVVTVLGGAVFGGWMGAVLAWTGAEIGTVAAHLLARRIARRPLQRLFGEHRLLRYLRESDTVLALFRLRVIPVAPFGVLDYVAGIANVSLRRLLLATAAGVLPSVVAYAWVGSELLAGLVNESDASRRALWVAGGVSVGMLLVSAIPQLVRRLKR